MAAVQTNTSGVILPDNLSDIIFQKAQENSIVMQLAQKTTVLPGTTEFQVITGDPEASWVSEGAQKPVSTPTFSSKVMTPYKMTTLVVVSNEFESDKSALFDQLVQRLPNALAKKFDSTVFGYDTAPGSNFDQLTAATAYDISTDTYDSLVDVYSHVTDAQGVLNGWAVSPKLQATLFKAKDTNNRPLFIQDLTTQNAIGSMLGAPIYSNTHAYHAATGDETVNVLGVAGDWTKSIYGVLDDITIRRSTDATITDGTNSYSLFQNNMQAILAEFRVGFIVESTDYFAKLTTPKA